MIRINLIKLLEELEHKLGRRVTLKEVSEKSGVDKNALSRLVNHPHVIPSSSVIDKLAQYFFFELTRDAEKPHLDHGRMRSVVKDLVRVYPDDEVFWAGIPAGLRDNPNVSLADIWALYSRFGALREGRGEPTERELKARIRDKLIDADRRRQEGEEIELSFTPSEFGLIMMAIPKNMGGSA